MRLSPLKSNVTQGLLFDEPLRGHGHVRTVVGELTERLTAALVNGRRHKTDCTADYCPDVSALGVYYESKACGRNRETFIYAGRLEKDRCFTALGNPLYYVVWSHCVETKLYETVAGLRAALMLGMRAVYVVPFNEISAICETLPLEKLNSAYGGTDRQTYGEGYRIPLSQLNPWCLGTFEGLVWPGES